MYIIIYLKTIRNRLIASSDVIQLIFSCKFI